MARAFFGEELEKALETLNHQFHSVRVYVEAHHHDRNGADKEFRMKIDSTIWSGYPTKAENEIDNTVDDLVKIIEDTCVPALRLEVRKPIKLKI